MTQTGIPDDLVTAYRSAHYRAGAGQSAITLRVDQYSEPLARLLATTGFRSAAFITACNPLGMRDSIEANRIACAHLREKLARHVSRPDQIVNGVAIDPFGSWPPEESFLVLGLDLDSARILGREFNQNALVWIEGDAIPRLMLLR